jgi:hypothetical protein
MIILRQIRHKLSKSRLRVPVIWARHLNVTPQDVLIASYPRSGSTWLRFALLEALTGDSSSFSNVNRLIPHVGHHRDALKLDRGGRLIKTHEPYRREYKRAVYIIRDARAVVLSEYAYQKALGLANDELDTYIARFVRGQVNANGAWQNHVASWVRASADNPNILIVQYERMRANPEDTLGSIVRFVGGQVDPEMIGAAIKNNSVESMRAKELSSPQRSSRRGRFIRSGSVAGWRERLTQAQLQLIESYTGDTLLRLEYALGTGSMVQAK